MNIGLISIILAFILSLIAGLSTGLGGCIALFVKNTNTKFLAISLGFSAGVMIYVSMVEILSEANNYLSISFGEKIGTLYTIIGFFGGMLLINLINKLIPNDINIYNSQKNKARLMRTGLFTAIAIAIHNFPEGIATFISSVQSLKVGIPIVIAIALHNIPEGISVSVPIYYATNNKEKAFRYSLFSGMAEPLGALIGYLILLPFMNDVIFGVLYAVVAGIMVFISIDELLPAAREYGKHSLSIYGLVGGMIFMSISLWLFI
ncbi:MAG: zinc transporter ZupT [Bacilli bacterium]